MRRSTESTLPFAAAEAGMLKSSRGRMPNRLHESRLELPGILHGRSLRGGPALPIALALAAALTILAAPTPSLSQAPRTLPVFENGQAQVVPGFADSTQWVRQRLWVETEFDSD